MSESETHQFRVVVKGKPDVVVGEDTIAHLASRFSATPGQIELILASPHYVLARGLTRTRAETYVQTLEGNGVAAVMEDESELLAIELPASTQNTDRLAPIESSETTIRRLADYQKAAGIAWIVLAVVQVLTVYGVIAGVWNLIIGIGQIKLSRRIRQRDASIPAEYQGIGGLVFIAILNIVLGGVVGILLVGLDFYIRDKVLSYRNLFNQISALEEAFQKEKAARRARMIAKGY